MLYINNFEIATIRIIQHGVRLFLSQPGKLYIMLNAGLYRRVK